MPVFVGRSDLETLLASDHAGDWVRISEMLLGPAPPVSTVPPLHWVLGVPVEGGA